MLRTIESLYGSPVAARDGEIGAVDQAYFDDEAWGVRYLVVKTGGWLNKGEVLVSPYSFKHPVAGSGTVEVDLTQQQVRDSPNIDTDKPVSRQHETEYLGYYGYPAYWGGAYLWGVGAYPAFGSMVSAPGIASEARTRRDREADNPPADTHLRSTKAVKGYHIEAADGSIGHVSGFIFDDVEWVIRYLIVDTRNWWPGGKEVLLATQWIGLVDWIGSTISTGLTRDAIKNSPSYDESVPLSRSDETTLYQYYGRDGYWSTDEGIESRSHRIRKAVADDRVRIFT
ncbi:PRC-barrel domain-containing protein [Paraburkholderia humisilvae]|uniref:PRC-barrel domain-containing protein n=1 Tax=Paraburkholderia humisilvae TaxID=627669 RepID=A0A6J5FBE8_9BURK|nr:PRC-barrel domain-containing protein [Paraburkholderia humisilvae]CAB3774777.1 hypothetical protein LMG29542_08159 [Paraburkholderia humisilvae]